MLSTGSALETQHPEISLSLSLSLSLFSISLTHTHTRASAYIFEEYALKALSQVLSINWRSHHAK